MEHNRGRKKREEYTTLLPGNTKHTGPAEIIEPVTTLLDEGKYLRIIARLPGIAEERIKIDLENSTPAVIIDASDSIRHYKKVIPLSFEVRFSRKRFSEGVLELILEKTKTETL